MAYENPSGTIFLHGKEQFAAMCVAMSTINHMLDSVDQKDFDDEKMQIEIKAVTSNCFRIEVGGLLNISDKDIQKWQG